MTTWVPSETGETSGTEVAAKAAEAESVSSANPSFFIVLCSVRAIKGRYDTATAAVLWENVMFFYGFVKQAWRNGNSGGTTGSFCGSGNGV